MSLKITYFAALIGAVTTILAPAVARAERSCETGLSSFGAITSLGAHVAGLTPRTPVDVQREVQSSCVASRPGHPMKNFIFLFEGRNGYAPPTERLLREFLARGPSCFKRDGVDYVRFSNGEERDWNGIRAIFDQSVPGGYTPVALKFMIVDTLCRKSNVRLEDTEIFYFPHSVPMSQVRDCALRQLALQRDLGAEPHVATLGFSWGGDAAIRAAAELRSARVDVKLGFTVDPVPQSIPHLLSRGAGRFMDRLMGGSGATPAFRAPDGVHWINYWQESDNRVGSVAGVPVGLQGSGVENASVNERVVPPDLEEASDGRNGGHWKIFLNPTVTDRLATELNAL